MGKLTNKIKIAYNSQFETGGAGSWL